MVLPGIGAPPLELEDEATLQGTHHKVHFLETLTTIDVATGHYGIIHAPNHG